MRSAERRELLRMYGNSILKADLSDDSVWSLVKLMDDGKALNGGTIVKMKGPGVIKFTVCGKNVGFWVE